MIFGIFTFIGSILLLGLIFSKYPLNKEELKDKEDMVKKILLWIIAFIIIIFQVLLILNIFFHFIELTGFWSHFFFWFVYIFLGAYGLLKIRGIIR